MNKIYLLIIIILISFAAGWQTAQWQQDSKKFKIAVTQQQDTAHVIETLNNIDKTHTKVREAVTNENADIVRNIDAGRIELRIPTIMPAVACSSGMDNASRKTNINTRTDAIIESRTAAKIAELTARGDDAIVKLATLQKYVNSVCLRQ